MKAASQMQQEVGRTMFRNLGTSELIIITLILVLLFGGKKIPEFIKGVGEAIKEFKRASKDK